jgi:hypothetical protein
MPTNHDKEQLSRAMLLGRYPLEPIVIAFAGVSEMPRMAPHQFND